MSRLFRDVDGGSRCPHGSVVCIGAFDGLHLGHRALVRHAVERARALDVPAVALSFEPLPREFFAADDPPPRLLLPRAKAERLLALGIDQVGLLRFDAKFSAMSAEDFVARVLVGMLAVREVWVGPGFRFGKGRAGALELLQSLGDKCAAHGQGFVAGAIEPVELDGERVSSTRIRAALQAGDFAAAARLLGRPYRIGGRVARGAQLGRTLGYPTANLRLGDRVPPLTGIHAARVYLARSGGSAGCAEKQVLRYAQDDSELRAPGDVGGSLPAVTSLGTRPTVNGTELLLEAHLFDFDGDLYGRRIEVEFVARLRDEKKFDDLPALTAQMHRDAEQARAILMNDQPRATA